MTPELVIVLTAALVATPCALAGSFLVLRKMAMLGDAISHAVLPGIAIAFLLAGGPEPLSVLVGAAAFGLITVVLVEALYRSRRVKEDAAIGLVFPALFALGVFLVARFGNQVHLDTEHVLYGEIAYAPWDTLIVGNLALGPRSFWVLGAVTLLNLAFVLLFYKELKVATFDPGLAAALGFSPVLVHYLLMAVVSITTVAAFDSVGAILVVALLIVPPATAYLLTDRLPLMLGLAVAAGVASAVFGYLLASALDGSIAGAMATVAGLLFAGALLASPRRGLLAGVIRHLRQRRQFAADLLILHLVEQERTSHAGGREILLAEPAIITAPAPVSISALQARFRWAPSFTRSAMNQAIAAGFAQPVGSAGTDPAGLVVTELGRARAIEILSR